MSRLPWLRSLCLLSSLRHCEGEGMDEGKFSNDRGWHMCVEALTSAAFVVVHGAAA